MPVNITTAISCTILIVLWLYLIWTFKRAEVNAWRFFIGSIGMFLIGMIFIKPYIITYINYALTAIVGLFGNITGWYQTLFAESAIFVNTSIGGVLLQIDVECSGVIEILAFLSILLFFDIYSHQEKILYGTLGVLYIILANAIRIITITVLVFIFGYEAYYISHAYIGRILFYFLSVELYFHTFTRPQINAMRVGNFKYQ